MSRLLLVGWDAADWKVARPLMARGEMPNLARLMREGAWGNLSTISPALSPMVWTSIATGKRPYKHGIHGFTEPAEDGLSVRPVSNLGRTTKAFWNILNQNGKRSIVVGWWPSHPAEPIRGAMVSNQFPLQTGDFPDAPLMPGTVWPVGWAERLAELRVHGIEVTGDILRMFVPDCDQVDQKNDRSLHDLAGIIAETMSIHCAATDLVEQEPWDLAAVYYPGIDHFSHRFMQYHARKPRAKGIVDPALFQSIVAHAYRYHDVMLGRLLQLAGPDCAVIVLSDHGFHSDRLLPDYIPAEAAGAAVEHRDFGIFCLRAPGVLPGERIYGAGVLDIAPTVLHLFGLPTGSDMDGHVLLNAFARREPLPPIPSWDGVAGADGRHPAGRQFDAMASAEALKQLVALGYIAPPGEDARRTVETCLTENRYNLARAWVNGGFPEQAAGILEQLIAADPEQGRFYEQLFYCRMQQHDYPKAGGVLDAFDLAAEAFARRAQEEIERRGAEVPAADQDPGSEREVFERRQLAEKSGGFTRSRMMLRARLALVEANTPPSKTRALALFEDLSRAVGTKPSFALFLAEGFAFLGEHERAFQHTRRALRSDPEDWRAMGVEARVHLAAGRYQDAAQRAIDSLSLIHFQPYLHHTAGLAFRALGEDLRAEHSFRTAISQMPGLVAAYEQLAEILRKDPARLGEASLQFARAQILRESRATGPETAEPHADESAALKLHGFSRWDGSPADRPRTITIVSGLPRSGTSMMMQMLAAAGIEPYTDRLRAADEDNPRGYFEHENAARLAQDASWLPAARGRAVKIVANLLPHLPAGEIYRVVFLGRNLDEVVASQKAMLVRLGRQGAALADEELKRIYIRQLTSVWTWLQSRPEIQSISVDYEDAWHDPAAVSAKLAAFVGLPFDQAAAASCVESSLRRQRRNSGIAAGA